MSSAFDRGPIPCGVIDGQWIPNQSTGAAPVHHDTLLAPGAFTAPPPVLAAPPAQQPPMAWHPHAPPFAGQHPGGFFPGPMAAHPPPAFFPFPPHPAFHSPHHFPIPWHPVAGPAPAPGPPAGSLADAVPGDALDGGLQGGIAYLFPKDHARVQVSFGGEKVWKGDDPELEFTCRKVPTGMALREFMEQMGAKGDDWVCTEVIEKGNGKWQKGTTIEYKDDKAKDPVEKFGWTKERSKTHPVFVVLHKK